jgi:hypothetical protein
MGFRDGEIAEREVEKGAVVVEGADALECGVVREGL